MLPRTGLAPQFHQLRFWSAPPTGCGPGSSRWECRNQFSGVGLQLDHLFRNCKVERVLAFNSSW